MRVRLRSMEQKLEERRSYFYQGERGDRSRKTTLGVMAAISLS
jgi:hypothetical protein